MDSWFREIPIPRTWRVYLATGFDFRGKNRSCFGSIGIPRLQSWTKRVENIKTRGYFAHYVLNIAHY